MSISLNGFLMPFPMQFFDNNTPSSPLAGGLLYTYAAGTTTALATYTDATGSTQAANPIVLDANGRATVFGGVNAYKLVLTDVNGVTIWTVDKVICNGANVSTGFSTYTTMGALVAVTPPDLTLALVAGYYAANDGGGGMFQYSSSSTATADSGMVLTPVGGVGRWLRQIGPTTEINIRWFGAKPAMADNRTVINNANAYAVSLGNKASIIVPLGTFVIWSDPTFTVPVKFESGGILSLHSAFSFNITPIIEDMGQHFVILDSQTAGVVFPVGSISKAQWFGAKGDGVQDDGPAFRNAVKSLCHGGTLIVPSSTASYLVGNDGVNTSEPIIPIINTDGGGNITIQGEGDGNRSYFVVKAATGSAYGVFGPTTGESLYSITIDSISINGNSVAGQVGLWMSSGASSITNCTVINCPGDGIRVGGIGTNVTDMKVTGCNLQDNGSSTTGHISVTSGTNVYIDNNRITDSASAALYGIYVSRGTAVALTNVFMRNNNLASCNIFLGSYGTVTNAISGAIVSGNKVDLSVSGQPGYANPNCIAMAGLTGAIDVSNNECLSNVTSHAINIYKNGSIAGGVYNVVNNRIFVIQSTGTVLIGGVAIADTYADASYPFMVIVAGNVIKNASAFSGQAAWGIYESGTNSATYCIYGVNSILNFAIVAGTSGQTKVSRTVDIPTDVNIPGNLTVGGTLTVTGNAIRGYIDGFQMSHDAGRNILTVGAGICTAQDGITMIKSDTAIAKIITNPSSPYGFVNFAKGTGVGGDPSVLTPNDGEWLHVFVILGSQGDVDVGVDTSIFATNLLKAANPIGHAEAVYQDYSKYRRIGSIRTQNSGGHYYIKRFTQVGEVFRWNLATDFQTDSITMVHTGGSAPILNWSDFLSGGTVTLLNTPPDITVESIIDLFHPDNGDLSILGVCFYPVGDYSSYRCLKTSGNGSDLTSVSVNYPFPQNNISIVNQQTGMATQDYSGGNATIEINVLSYHDFRGKDA